MSSQQHRLRDLLTVAKATSGLTVRELADKAGLSSSTIQNYLDGRGRKTQIPDETLAQLARGFGIPYPRVRAAHLADQGLTEVPRQNAQEPGQGVVAAILADDRLLPEAREHLVRQYGLLLRIHGESEDQALRDQAAKAAADVTELEGRRRPAKATKRPAPKRRG